MEQKNNVKKKQDGHIKKIAKKINKYKKVVTFDDHGIELLDDESRAINIRLNNISDAYSKYNAHTKDTIEPELLDYLENYSRRIDIKHKLTIKIETTATKEEKEDLSLCFKNQFMANLKKQKQMLNYNLMTFITLLITGLLIIATSFAVSFVDSTSFFTNLINLFGTFFVWQSSDFFFIKRRQARYRYTRAINLYESNIIFTKKDN